MNLLLPNIKAKIPPRQANPCIPLASRAPSIPLTILAHGSSNGFNKNPRMASQLANWLPKESIVTDTEMAALRRLTTSLEIMPVGDRVPF